MTKICAVITSPADVHEAKNLGAEAFEFRFDLFSEIPDDWSFLSRPELTIATFHREETEERCRKALAAGVDYVDLDISSELCGRFPGKTICSCHDYTKTPDEGTILSLHARLSDFGIPKLAFQVNTAVDLLTLAAAETKLKASGKPFILIGMGSLGTITRIRFSSMVSYCCLSDEKKTAEGQLTIAAAKRLGSEPAVAGLIGKSLAQSRSPAIQNAAFASVQMQGIYLLFPLQEKELPLVPELMKRYRLLGLNVTIPYKETIIPYLSSLSGDAEAVRAVNTVTADLRGENTDWVGIRETLSTIEVVKKHVLVLGAGGAARAAIYCLKKLGAQITVVNRTYEKAQKLAEEFGSIALRINEVSGRYDIAVNASPVCPLTSVPADYVFDMTYPSSGISSTAVTGKTMLIYQGAASFACWTGKRPSVEAMEAAYEEAT